MLVTTPPDAPFEDAAMPGLARALDLCVMRPLIANCLGMEATGVASIRARIARHKPGRRCLVEYEIDGETRVSLFGKIRAKGFDGNSYEAQRSLWAAGLPVAEPLGAVPDMGMWLQRKAAGQSAASLFRPGDVTALAGRIAEALALLHHAGVPSSRHWTLRDEMNVLRARLPEAAASCPGLADSILAVLEKCERLAPLIPEGRPAGLHRDFYPDQVLVDGDRLHLVDLDLYAIGDPALDAGNFIAHLTEQALRLHGDAKVLASQEAALRERFLALSPQVAPEAVDAYAALALARHVFLSTRFDDRRHMTRDLVALSGLQLDCVAARLRSRCGDRATSSPRAPS